MRLLLTAATAASVSLFLPLWPFPHQHLAHQAPEAVDFLVAVPEEAVLLVATDELDAIRVRGKDNSWVRFFRDEEFSPLWEMIPFDEIFPEEDDDVPWFHPLDVLASIHGRVACFLSPAGEEGLMGGGLLVEPGEPNEAFLEFWDRARLELEGSEDGIISTLEYAGVELMVAEDPSKDPEDEEVSTTCVLFEVEGLFAVVVSESPDAALDLAYGVIDRTAGNDPSLGFTANAAYQGTREPGEIS
ncbi:MAG: hypothetical protein O7B99_10680, partial [Planctomycetota bacterium]|nr:hypothetical protein [Planctomycetota bacterium]